MTERLLQEQQVARLLGRAAELQEHASRRAEAGDESVESHPAEGSLQLAEVQAAAAEAGIDAQYVALAALELAAAPPGPSTALTVVQRRRAARWLGASESEARHVQRFEGPIEPLLATIGHTVQSPRYNLRLTEATPHLERGGTMLLEVPQWMSPTGSFHMFGYYLRGILGSEQVRLSITPRGPQAHEVAVAIDVDQSWPSMIAWGLGTAMLIAVVTGAIGWGVSSGLAAPLVAVMAIAAAFAGAGLWLGAKLLRWYYGHAVHTAQQQLRELLRDIDGTRRSQAVFGVLPPGSPGAAPGDAATKAGPGDT